MTMHVAAGGVPAQVADPKADTGDMSDDLLDRIDQRTRLAGHNRLALLLFRLGGRQIFGVNVFKVQEVLRRPSLFQVPGLPAQFAGVADVRGRSVPVAGTAARPPCFARRPANRDNTDSLRAPCAAHTPLARKPACPTRRRSSTP